MSAACDTAFRVQCRRSNRGLFTWANELKPVTSNPAKGVTLLKRANDEDGFHTGNEDDLARFAGLSPVDTR